MTAAQYEQSVTDAIRARIAAEPSLAPCVCGTEDEPDLDRLYYWNTWYTVDCNNCGTSLAAPTKDAAVKLWNAAMRHDAIESERAAWMKEAAMLLAALQYMVDVFHDDPESGQSMQHAAIEQAQLAIERATKA